MLADFRQNFQAQGFSWLLEFIVLHIAALTAYRLLMTWVYAHTQSLLLAIVMHASYRGWQLILYPAATFEHGLIWEATLAVALWVVVIAVFTLCGPRLAMRLAK